MFDLVKCDHSDYLDAFDKAELKQFNQLVCLNCHFILKKIKKNHTQIIESYNILLSGKFTNTTVNRKKLNSLILQKVVDDLHLPPDIELPETSIDIESNQKDFNNIQNGSNKHKNHNIDNEVEDNSNLEQSHTQNMDKVQNSSNIAQNYTQNMDNVQNNSNIKQSYMDNRQDHSNIDQSYTQNMDNKHNNSNMVPFTIEQNVVQEQNRLNKNIKTALEILERNNQSFVSLSSQLQFLNGEHLSFLEPTLLCKEILSDIPLVPSKSLSIDLDNGMLNNSKLEIDGTDKIFYDCLDLSPELVEKGMDATEVMQNVVTHAKIHGEIEPKIKYRVAKPKNGKKVQTFISTPQIRRIKLTHEELDRERVTKAQSKAYLRYKFKCESCIVGFNYMENLEDHVKRKHGSKERDGVICSICLQVIPNHGCVTEHNYRHYTRYECVRCNKRYHTYDEVTRHYTKHQCTKNISEKRSLKNKTTVQLKRTKIKMKPCKA